MPYIKGTVQNHQFGALVLRNMFFFLIQFICEFKILFEKCRKLLVFIIEYIRFILSLSSLLEMLTPKKHHLNSFIVVTRV